MQNICNSIIKYDSLQLLSLRLLYLTLKAVHFPKAKNIHIMALVYHSPFSKKNQFTTFPALF